MRIAIDSRMYGSEQFTGIGTYIQRMTDELFKLDNENEYIMFMREPWFSRFVPPNERVKKVLVTSKHYSYAEQVKLPFEFMKAKFDLIHYPHFNAPILFPKKSVCTIHDLTPFTFPGHKAKSGWRNWAYRSVFRATVGKASRVIAVSNSTKLDMVKHFNVAAEKISVIYEGVDERFTIIKNSGIISEVKKKFGITKPYILYVGVWRSHKNIEALVRAFTNLKKTYKIEHQLVVGGREDLHYTNVRKEINASPFKNDIITLGYVENNELPIIYSGADLFVLPSYIEGFGLIAIEAQACGCPVVSTKTSSMPEVLGDSALFFDPRNVDEMTAQIYRALIEPGTREDLIFRGKNNATRFRWKKCAVETLHAYKETN